MFIRWTQEEVDLLTSMINDGKSLQQIATQFAENAITTTQGFPCLRSDKAIERKKESLGLSVQPHIDDKWEAIRYAQKRYKSKSKENKTGLVKNANVKILVLSDIHFPFAREDYLKQAIDTHSDANMVVINGDMIDGYAHSFFDKEERVAAIDEYNIAHEFLFMLSQKFPKVYLTRGNHDIRALKAIKKSFEVEAYSVFSPDLIARLANGEKLRRDGTVECIRDFSNVFYSPVEPWWIQIGKTIFIHPHSRGSSKPAFTVSGWAKKFLSRLPYGSFDSIVCGHTHNTSKHIENSILLIEEGCLCDYQAYSWQPRDLYYSNASNGYAVIYQDNAGNTDFNKSTYVYLGSLLPADKPIISHKALTNERASQAS